jgi:hypothetical protein
VNPIIARDTAGLGAVPQLLSGALYESAGRAPRRGRGAVSLSSAAAPSSYDVIQGKTMVDTWAGPLGGRLRARGEQTLTPIEVVFEDYASHLEPAGILSLTRGYLGTRPNQLLRSCPLARVDDGG